MPTREVIVVLGLLGRFPFAGIAWQLLHHLVPLRQLGFDVYYVEDTGAMPYDPRVKSVVNECAYSLWWIADTLARAGMAEAWAYRDAIQGRWYGLSGQRVREVMACAVGVLNLCGASDPVAMECPPRGKLLYLETDPVLYQMRLAQGDEATRCWLASHDVHFTYGANLGAPDCPVPLLQFRWHKTYPPVVLECWPYCEASTGARFTTIATWHNRGKDITFGGETYRWSKHLNFLALADLPEHTSQPLELAVEIDDPRALATFRRHGWVLTNPLTVSQDLAGYRDYIVSSRGEFTVAKDLVVRSRSGWFSDRSVCYLAAGKPVVMQETGFSKYIPTGEGLFAFTTLEEAVGALEAINGDYVRHARAAREIAREYFDATKLLRQLLQEAGIG